MLRWHRGDGRTHCRRVQPHADELGRCVYPGNNLRPTSHLYDSCNIGCDEAQGAVFLWFPQ